MSFPAIMSSRRLSTILIVILGPKSETNKACNSETSISLSFPEKFWENNKEEQNWNLFQFVEDSVCVGEVPVKQELVNYGEVVSGFGESRKYLFHVTLCFLLYQPTESGEESRLTSRAFEPVRCRSSCCEWRHSCLRDDEAMMLWLWKFRDEWEMCRWSHFCFWKWVSQ